MEFKGTQEKWKIVDNDNTSLTNIVTKKNRICEVKHFDQQIDENLLEPSIEEGKANAQLIATAPELLKALQKIIKVTNPTLRDDHVSGYTTSELSKPLYNAIKSINKALGL